ncbi:MAG: D-sedoheptulose 7-phosphate isomerase [Vicinamibacterales bacterium]|nr:D-sedoheptulose 7-phosphate isomerase [Vicinamibacterales bacterium]
MPGGDRERFVEEIFRDTAALQEQSGGRLAGGIVAAADLLKTAFAAGGQLLVFGNGGSALDAQHFASELVGRFSRERRALAAIALTTDTSIITSVANDYSYQRVFARQIEGLGRRGDVAWGISTSGTSPNVLEALTFAKSRGLATVALTGRDGGTIGPAADLHLNVPHAVTARIQEVHRTLIHAVCELVERDL